MRTALKHVLMDPAAPTSGESGGGGPAPVDHAAIEKARLEERNKLQGQLLDAKGQLDAARGKVDELTVAQASLQEQLTALKTTYEALKAGTKADGGVDVEKAIQSAVDAALGRQGPALQTEISELRGQLDAERKLRVVAEATQLRQTLIAAAGGTAALIPELVSGQTREEIEASIANSKAIFERAVTGAVARGAGGSSTARGTGNGLPTVPLGNAAPGNRDGNSDEGESIRTQLSSGGLTTAAEFRKARTDLNRLKQEALARAQGR